MTWRVMEKPGVCVIRRSMRSKDERETLPCFGVRRGNTRGRAFMPKSPNRTRQAVFSRISNSSAHHERLVRRHIFII
jgi:hypothetical protein